MSWRIRRAGIDDLDGIDDVERDAFPASMRYDRETFRHRLAGRPDGIARERVYFVAVDRTRIVGYGECAIETPSVALFGMVEPLSAICRPEQEIGVLISMGVHPDARGRGIGKGLVRARLKHLRDAGIRQVVTHVWPNGGFPRIAHATGFCEVPGWSGRTYADGSSALLYYRSLEDR